MGDDLATATNAAMTLRLDGKELKTADLTLGDWGELEQWMRAKVITLARASFTPDTSEADKRLILEVAFDKAAKLSLAASMAAKKGKAPDPQQVAIAQQVRALYSSPEGLEQVLLLSLSHHQPGITRDEVRQVLEDADNQLVIIEKIMRGSAGGDKPHPKAKAPAKAQTGQ